MTEQDHGRNTLSKLVFVNDTSSSITCWKNTVSNTIAPGPTALGLEDIAETDEGVIENKELNAGEVITTEEVGEGLSCGLRPGEAAADIEAEIADEDSLSELAAEGLAGATLLETPDRLLGPTTLLDGLGAEDGTAELLGLAETLGDIKTRELDDATVEMLLTGERLDAELTIETALDTATLGELAALRLLTDDALDADDRIDDRLLPALDGEAEELLDTLTAGEIDDTLLLLLTEATTDELLDTEEVTDGLLNTLLCAELTRELPELSELGDEATELGAAELARLLGALLELDELAKALGLGDGLA